MSEREKPRYFNNDRLTARTLCGNRSYENGERWKIAGRKHTRAIKLLRVEQFPFKTARAVFFVPDVKSAPWLSRRSFAEAIIARTAPHAGWNTTIASTTRRSASPVKDSAPAKVRIPFVESFFQTEIGAEEYDIKFENCSLDEN